ncbi:neprilysin-2-like [Haemaphysalis longicornis]
MELVIGYPDWMLDSNIMNALYRFAPRISESSSYVEHFHWLHENSHFQELLRVKSEFFDKKYEDIALKSHAYYTETTETLVYPAAALVTHYRKPPIPRAINFGTIGTNLAQLLTNTIDRFDFAYNGTHKITQDFWDETTRSNFCDRSPCLKNTEECEVETEKLQKLRDYLGIRVAHKALRRSKQSYSGPFLLPGKRFKTESKIFFILFGSLYCPFSVNERVVESRKDSVDEAFRKSLSEIVYHYEDFNKTFHCNATANVDTCRLMPTN